MTGTPTPRSRSFRTISGTAAAAASLLTVTRTSSLPACASANLDRGAVRVGRVGVGHRLDDDGMARFRPPDVDAHVDRRHGPDAGPREVALMTALIAPAEAGDVEAEIQRMKAIRTTKPTA